MTKQQVFDILSRELKLHPWAQDADRFKAMMDAVESTLNGSHKCALTESWTVAWREIGKKGKPTYKGFHALPGVIVRSEAG